uniref:NADH-ubiquinone oxidoreductase chain 4L n=1 Tax=Pseudanthias dispar TaxID=1630944 RepID=A0A0N6WAB2_9TELE|nr:NADH dehydrogenase subunit 4L [Pseudanthias dispar]AJW75398.1 NADH dehydrogenase subunit 4L [Pseudanthias dispar]WNH20823.1 NADH dehydrogenase subunit 4L [Pseudanthias bicolor]
MSISQFTFTSAFALGLAGLCFHRTHFLSALLCLEGIMLTLFIGMAMWVLQVEFSSFSLAPLLLLAFSACEASVGLSLLVATVRTHGSDRLTSMTSLQC